MNEVSPKPAPFGITACALGFLSFAIVVGLFFGGPIDRPPPVEVSIAKKAVEIRDATVAALKGEEYEAETQPRKRSMDFYVRTGAIALGVAAILMGVIGLIRHERARISITGGVLGGLAIVFEVAVVFFFAMLFVSLLVAVIDKLDFDIFS